MTAVTRSHPPVTSGGAMRGAQSPRIVPCSRQGRGLAAAGHGRTQGGGGGWRGLKRHVRARSAAAAGGELGGRPRSRGKSGPRGGRGPKLRAAGSSPPAIRSRAGGG